jgi:hypothetical protein
VVECVPVSDVSGLGQYEAVVLGGAVYVNHWRGGPYGFSTGTRASCRRYRSGPSAPGRWERTDPVPISSSRAARSTRASAFRHADMWCSVDGSTSQGTDH